MRAEWVEIVIPSHADDMTPSPPVRAEWVEIDSIRLPLFSSSSPPVRAEWVEMYLAGPCFPRSICLRP